MNFSTQTQASKIRTHLLAGKSITPGHALLVYGISRLAVAVNVLRLGGLDIDMTMKVDEQGKKYGEYKLSAAIKTGQRVQVKRGHGYGLPHWVRFTQASKVVGLVKDVAYVQFEKNRDVSETIPMNVRELSVVC